MNEAKGLTRKQLANASGAQPYIITYLFDTGRLPVIRQSSGPGDPTLYHPDSVDTAYRSRW